MALQEITNVHRNLGGYSASCVLPAKYRPLICRGQRLIQQTPRSEFPANRLAGNCNLDLWLDGEIYPLDPKTGKAPSFTDLTSFLCFVGDGNRGLYGYAMSLRDSVDYIQKEILEQKCSELASLLEQSRAQYNTLLLASVAEKKTADSRNLHDRHIFEAYVSSLLSRFHESEVQFSAQLNHLKAEISCHVLDKARHQKEAAKEMEDQITAASNEMLSLRNIHKSKINDFTIDMLRVKNELGKLQLKYSKLSKSPLDQLLQGSRKRKDVCELSERGGYVRRLRQRIRYILQPQTVKAIQGRNANNGTRNHICGDANNQKTTATVIASILSTREAHALVENPKLTPAVIRANNKCLVSLGSQVGAQDILAVCDRSGVSQKGYAAIYKTMKHGLRSVNPKLNFKCLPNPHKIGLLRSSLNSNLRQYVGDYYHICDSFEIQQPKNAKDDPKKKTGPTHLILNDNNTLFVDLETVQRSMVRLYKFTLEELNGRPLIFVLKMDEAEIVKHEKFERISITVMNRALNSNVDHDDSRYFSVQSDNDIWPIATFRVIKESHECLKWVLNQTSIPVVIKAQSNGAKLSVDGIGEFPVEWHLACDMKTIKCLYGFSHGPTAKHPCIYCWQQKVQGKVLTTTQASNVEKNKQLWSGGLFSSSIASEPVRGPNGTGQWSPILDIPLNRVHICTLHAQCRIVEKIIHLHICYAWSIKDVAVRKEAITAMEHALSKAGVAGGAVVLTKDARLSGKHSDLPSKLSFNGTRCRALFSPSSWSRFDKVWKDVCEAEQNNTSLGGSKRDKQDMWSAFGELQVYFNSMTLTMQQRAEYKEKVEKWGKLFLKAFGEGHVTHYVHVLVKHSTWFVNTYGSLAVWSTQGMEKSHYTAKTAYHKHTQHSGTTARRSAIVQTYEWWFRVIQHREYEINKKFEESQVALTTNNVSRTRRQQSTLNSSASIKHAQWRENRIRRGSVWALQEDMNLEV